MKKQLLAALFTLSLSLSACSGTPPQTNVSESNTNTLNEETEEQETSFSAFLDYLFKEELENDYNTYHTYVQNSENFGIEHNSIDVSLGSFGPSMSEEEKTEEEKDLETLKSFDYKTLNDEEKDIYDQLIYTFDLNKRINDEKYDYLECIWSGTSSVSTNLYNLFMEYTFYTEQDVKDCIVLINDIPRYTKEVLDYTNKQADKGLLMIEYENVVSGIKEIIDSQNKNNVLNALTKAMDSLDLEASKKEDYTKQIKEALDKNFYPSYQSMIDGLANIKNKNKEHTGLKNLPNGKDFYLELIRYYTGTSDKPEDIRKKLETVIDDAMTIIYTTYTDDTISTGFKSTDDIMKFLEKNYTKEFPKIKIPSYNVEALSKEQEEDNIVAYYVIPAIDYTGSEKIRYNSHNQNAQYNSLEFYQTLAHEGLPGHMYAKEYAREHQKYNIHHLLSNLGFSEGYATYVESRSLHFLSLNKDALESENAYMVLNNAYTCLMDLSVNYDGLSYEQFQKKYSSLFGNDLVDIYNTLCESPGIFMAYYYGYFTILDLRQEAQTALGNKFDNIKFNAALLQSGDVNFDIIKRSVEKYIESEK